MSTDTLTALDIRPMVDQILNEALTRRASDVHFEPGETGFEIKFRIDGVLEKYENLDQPSGRAAVGRLMVMGKLLTYRMDVPQEGRIAFSKSGLECGVELRLAVMPTVHGVRAAVRLPADDSVAVVLGQLGFTSGVLDGLKRFVAGDSGMLVL